ncbi:MAG: response regulator [Candidatus Hydrogenedentota bacterium]
MSSQMTTEAAVDVWEKTCDAPADNRPRVLVVDDENGPRQALRILLKPEFDVYVADGVSGALQSLECEEVDVVITDIRMPKKSGIDLLRAVKTHWPELEVLILTGYGQLDTAMKAIDLGAAAYVEKPFDNEVMLHKVRRAVARRREAREHRALEELAFKASRFETLGRLVTGTMHDLGTPLSVINTHIDLLVRDEWPPTLITRLESIRSQVGYCNDIVRTTMNFLRNTPTKRTCFSLNNVVRTCLDVAGPVLAKEGMEIRFEPAPGLSTLTGELILVRQAVLNLVTNASQAMQDQAMPKRIEIRTWEADGWTCLSVQDNGPGIAPADRRRIFDTLFTTKTDHGTGLGLAVVQHVMVHHQGDVHLEDPPEGGACFVLRFPTDDDNTTRENT